MRIFWKACKLLRRVLPVDIMTAAIKRKTKDRTSLTAVRQWSGKEGIRKRKVSKENCDGCESWASVSAEY
jgi:hypothetical protein